MIEEALKKILTKDPAISKLVASRVFPLIRPQGSALPAITYQRASGIRDHDMEGATGLVESRFLIGCYGKKRGRKSSYLIAKQVRDAVVAKILPAGGFRETVGSIEIQSIFLNNEDDSHMDGATGVGMVRVLLDCTIWHKET